MFIKIADESEELMNSTLQPTYYLDWAIPALARL